ncbi:MULTISPECIES: hypothetical protein [unclassified Methylobacterium]|uniref:hypothetical protein n=1 Tax=unclassified Methylobacterium TaxID=2615210 RepID=UPI00138F90C9|nr:MULTISPECIES: hypothetical protein [unclassified Methylobacterium]
MLQLDATAADLVRAAMDAHPHRNEVPIHRTDGVTGITVSSQRLTAIVSNIFDGFSLGKLVASEPWTDEPAWRGICDDCGLNGGFLRKRLPSMLAWTAAT